MNVLERSSELVGRAQIRLEMEPFQSILFELNQTLHWRGPHAATCFS